MGKYSLLDKQELIDADHCLIKLFISNPVLSEHQHMHWY